MEPVVVDPESEQDSSTTASPTTETITPDSQPAAAETGHGRKRGRDDDCKDDEDDQGRSTTLQQWEDWRVQLTELLVNCCGEGSNDDEPSRVAAAVVDLLKQNVPPSDDKNTIPHRFVTLPPLTDKTHRKRVHEWIRQYWSADKLGFADTQDGGVIRIWHPYYAREMPDYNKFENGGSKKRAKGSDKKYIELVLYKENMDTGFAISQLQKRAVGPPGRDRRAGRGGRGGRPQNEWRVGHAGMKDKRGVTSQFITIPASTQIEQFCRTWNGNGPKTNSSNGGGGNTVDSGVALLRVGGFRYTDSPLVLGALSGNRFDIVLRNVQGSSTDRAQTKREVEQAVDSLRQFGFINYFGMQRFGKYHDTHLTGMAVIRGDYEQAIDIIMEEKPDENERSQGARAAFQNRFVELTKSSSQGDGQADMEQRRKDAERDVAKKIRPDIGRFAVNEGVILESLVRYPRDYKQAYGSIARTMKMMFMHSVQSYLWNHVASYRISHFGKTVAIGDLVLESNGIDSEKARGHNVPAVRTVTENDISSGKYSLDDVVLPLVGSRTVLPSNSCADIFHSVLKKHNLSMEMLCNPSQDSRDLNFDGDYRNLICHPSDVDAEILAYRDPKEPLLHTDLMSVHGVGIRCASAAGKDAESFPLLGVRAGFSLPSSAYATMALRELMKRPTSSEYQTRLSLGGETNRDQELHSISDGRGT
jgi:tRNA pseudouridine13 synthase